jgi:large subunit ribosomal protein L22
MTAAKTNESPVLAHKSDQRGPANQQVRAHAKYIRTSPYKMRVVLNLIRGQKVSDAADILRLCERDAAITIGKVLRSAVANAVNNDGIPAEELYVSACFADEGPTIKRFRPRARGRTGQILKRTSHITIVVSSLPESMLDAARSKGVAAAEARARRTAGNKASAESKAADTRRAASGTTEAVAGVSDAEPVESAVVESDVVESAVVESAVVESPQIQGLVGATDTIESTVTDTPAETALVETSEAEPAVAVGGAVEPDRLNQIIGIGPKLEEELHTAGIMTFAQLANLSDADIVELDAKVSRSAEQITDWRTQAQQIIDGTWVDTSTKNT